MVAIGQTAFGQVTSVSNDLGDLGRKRDSLLEHLRSDVFVAFQARDRLIQLRKTADFFEKFRRGDAVFMIYDPQKPARAEIRTFWQLWGLPLEFFGLAVVVACLIARTRFRW